MVHPSDNLTTSQRQSSDVGPADDSVVIARLCEEYCQLRNAGAAVSVSEFASRYPGVHVPLLNALNALELLGSFQPGDEQYDTTAAPSEIAGCQVIREIGRGGMGIVYEARHPTVSRQLAIKLLINRRGLRESFRERFRREAEATSRLTHPNIVPFIDCGEHEGTPFISMLFVDGESLDHLLDRYWDNQQDHSGNSRKQIVGVDFQSIARMGAAIASALAHAHMKGAIHRDIKPANLILDSQNKVWVADFGLAKLRDEDDDLSKTGDMIGTPRYMAPEQIRGVADERSDIYSLGITLWELATGCRAWDTADSSAMIAAKSAMQLPRIREVHPDVPISLARIIDKCCSTKPRKRFRSAEQLRSALSEFADGAISEADDVSPSRAAVTMVCLVVCILFSALATRGFMAAENSGIDANAAASAESAPISHAGKITQISMSEGRISVPDLRLTANNPEGKPFYWRLANTMDAEHFLVQQLAGTICFASSPSVDQPLDEDADNVYELEFTATQSLAPSVRIVIANQSQLQLLDPIFRTTASLRLPGNLHTITAIGKSQFLHTHVGNDGSIALFRTNSHSNPPSSMLLNSRCGISPFIRDLAAMGNGEFVALENSKDGFGLRRLTLNSNNEFQEGGLIRNLNFARNPVGIALLSDSDLLVLDRGSDGTSLRLFEAAISGESIVSSQELPTGWTCDSRIHGIVSWQGPVSKTSSAGIRRLVRIKVEAAGEESTLR